MLASVAPQHVQRGPAEAVLLQALQAQQLCQAKQALQPKVPQQAASQPAKQASESLQPPAQQSRQQRPVVPKLALEQLAVPPLTTVQSDLPKLSASYSSSESVCSFGAGDSSSTITTCPPGNTTAPGSSLETLAAESSESASLLRLENTILWEQVREHRQRIEELSQRLHAVEGGHKLPQVVESQGVVAGSGAAQAKTGAGTELASSSTAIAMPGVPSPAPSPSQRSQLGGAQRSSLAVEALLWEAAAPAAATPSGAGFALHPRPWPPPEARGAELEASGGGNPVLAPSICDLSAAAGGCKSALFTQLSNLKAQMAAVEAQGEALRAATRSVEDEYRKMALDDCGAATTVGFWPRRGLLEASAAGGG